MVQSNAATRLRETLAAPAAAPNFLERARKERVARLAAPAADPVARQEIVPQTPPARLSVEDAPAAARHLSALQRLRAVAASMKSQVQDDFAEPGNEASVSTASTVPTEVELTEVEGTLSSVRNFNDWAVGLVWTEDREEVRVTGEVIAGLTEGLEYRFSGVTKSHPKHGDSVEVVSYEPVITLDPKAMERYMVKAFKGIGPAKAAKFIDRVQDLAVDLAWDNAVESAEPLGRAETEEIRHRALLELRNTLLHEPWKLDLSALAKDASFADGVDPQAEAKRLVLTRNLMLRLGGVAGLRDGVAKSLAAYLLLQIKGDEPQADAFVDPIEASWKVLVSNPYAPIRKASGYGFATAELVARSIGVPRDSPLRLAALVEFAVTQECQRRGHVFLSPKDFVSAVRRVDPTAPAQASLVHGIKAGLLVIDAEANRVYAPQMHAAEVRLAKSIARRIRAETSLTQRSPEAVSAKLKKSASKINPAFAGGLDAEQVNAVASIMTAQTQLHVLTGGPGTGKTSIIECLVYLLKGRRFLFAAPTGKASKVLTSRVKSLGYESNTTCSLLRGSEESGFAINGTEQLECDVLVIDESTMNGVVMADAIFDALPEDAHVIFLGDPGVPGREGRPARAGQLPSISPGRFMLDLLDLPAVNHVHLTKTWRNSGGILEVVDEVARGRLVVQDRVSVRFRPLPDAVVGFPGVMQAYLESVQKYGVESTAMIMPKRQGNRNEPDWNITYANAVLREVCNPHAIKLPGTMLHLGDRVILRENMIIKQPDADALGRVAASVASPLKKGVGSPLDFEKLLRDQGLAQPETSDDDEISPIEDVDFEEAGSERVVNGDTGTLISYAVDDQNQRMGSPKWVKLALDDGREIWYPGSDLGAIDHAYALTNHAVQGSEYQKVISVVTPGSPDFMNQNMLLTALSRARSDLEIYGDPDTLRKIAATPMPKRNSALSERVNQEMARLEEIESRDDVAEPVAGD